MRVLHLTAGTKWTGPAAVAVGQVMAMRAAGIEAEIAIARDSPLASRLAGHGWVRPVLSPGRRPGDFLDDVSALDGVLSRERFETVHSHSSHDHLVARAAVGRARLPLVRSFHHESGFRPLLSSWGRRRASGFAFSNGALQAAFCARFRPSAPCARFSPVAETDRFSPGPRDPGIRAALGIPEDAFVAGTIGKMAAGRGHDAAIRILAGTSDPKIALLHVGKGEAKERLWELAAQLGVGARNFGAGYREEDLPEIYRAMDAFLFTASGADQGHRAILEAMASGLPVVVLDLPGVADFEIVKGPGFVARSEEEASASLDFLATHAGPRMGMADAARKRAERFSGAEFSRGAADFYAAVLDFWKNGRGRDVETRKERA
ncbi:MAG TPA: glycosyltransferase family 4 protein [Thermoanaerobaculia bacterium]|nr:glycosyltransferase family 4 protein [Thermoanaerobaculia bacterium]